MATTADINATIFPSLTLTRMNDENTSTFMLNQSIAPMDVDDYQPLIDSNPSGANMNGRLSPFHPIENGMDGGADDDEIGKRDNHRSGNPVLNKSFDVLPQVKDYDTPSADLETSRKHTHVLDTTVELPNTNDGFEEKLSHDSNILRPVNNIDTPIHGPLLLSNQCSLEYPYAIPQRLETIPSCSADDSPETVTTFTKQMELTVNKAQHDQEPVTPILSNEKFFDANTFVLKKKERRKLPTPTNENNCNETSEETPPDLCNKLSPFNTPSVSLDTHLMSRQVVATSLSQRLSDPTKIIDCVEQYYRILYRVCECTEELKQELRQVKSERDQMSEDLINAENAFTDVRKRNEKLKLIVNEHKMNTETLKRFSEESVRYTEEQKQKYAVLKQHAQEKLNEANSEMERVRRTNESEMEGVQAQLRYAQLRVQSLEQEMRSVKQELDQKKKENLELTNICDELLTTGKR